MLPTTRTNPLKATPTDKNFQNSDQKHNNPTDSTKPHIPEGPSQSSHHSPLSSTPKSNLLTIQCDLSIIETNLHSQLQTLNTKISTFTTEKQQMEQKISHLSILLQNNQTRQQTLQKLVIDGFRSTVVQIQELKNNLDQEMGGNWFQVCQENLNTEQQKLTDVFEDKINGYVEEIYEISEKLKNIDDDVYRKVVDGLSDYRRKELLENEGQPKQRDYVLEESEDPLSVSSKEKDQTRGGPRKPTIKINERFNKKYQDSSKRSSINDAVKGHFSKDKQQFDQISHHQYGSLNGQKSNNDFTSKVSVDLMDGFSSKKFHENNDTRKQQKEGQQFIHHKINLSSKGRANKAGLRKNTEINHGQRPKSNNGGRKLTRKQLVEEMERNKKQQLEEQIERLIKRIHLQGNNPHGSIMKKEQLQQWKVKISMLQTTINSISTKMEQYGVGLEQIKNKQSLTYNNLLGEIDKKCLRFVNEKMSQKRNKGEVAHGDVQSQVVVKVMDTIREQFLFGYEKKMQEIVKRIKEIEETTAYDEGGIYEQEQEQEQESEITSPRKNTPVNQILIRKAKKNISRKSSKKIASSSNSVDSDGLESQTKQQTLPQQQKQRQASEQNSKKTAIKIKTSSSTTKFTPLIHDTLSLPNIMNRLLKLQEVVQEINMKQYGNEKEGQEVPPFGIISDEGENYTAQQKLLQQRSAPINSHTRNHTMFPSSSSSNNKTLQQQQQIIISTLNHLKKSLHKNQNHSQQNQIYISRIDKQLQSISQIRQKRILNLIEEKVNKMLLQPFNQHYTKKLKHDIQKEFIEIKHEYAFIWKQIENKLKDRVDKKQLKKINQQTEIAICEVKKGIGKKVDSEDFKKGIKYLENKLKDMWGLLKEGYEDFSGGSGFMNGQNGGVEDFYNRTEQPQFQQSQSGLTGKGFMNSGGNGTAFNNGNGVSLAETRLLMNSSNNGSNSHSASRFIKR